MRKRNVEVKFRLSEAEYAELVQKVKDSGLNRNAFLVRMVRQQTIYPVDYLRELNKQMDVLLAQIRGMATNLNQDCEYPKGSAVYPISGGPFERHG